MHHLKCTKNLLDSCGLGWTCLCWSAATWLKSLTGFNLTQPSWTLLVGAHLNLESDRTQLDSTHLDSVGGCPPDSRVWLDSTWLNPAELCWWVPTLTGWMVCVSSPHRANRRLSRPEHPYQLQAYAAHYSIDTRGSFSVGKVASVWSWPLTFFISCQG